MEMQQGISERNPLDREILRDLGGIYGTASNAYEGAGDYPAALDYGRKSTNIAEDFFERDRWVRRRDRQRRSPCAMKPDGAL